MSKTNDLGRDPIGKLVLKLAIPSMLAQFVNVFYGIVDRMYIGHIPDVGPNTRCGRVRPHRHPDLFFCLLGGLGRSAADGHPIG